MRIREPRAGGVSRRAILASLALPLTAQNLERGTALPADWARFLDAATEAEVVRLTDPAYESWLPPPPARAMARKGNGLFYASTRLGKPQAYRMDLGSGQAKLLTSAAALDPKTLSVLPDEKSILFFDGPSLKVAQVGKAVEYEAAAVRQGWERAGGPSTAEDGQSVYWLERRGESSEVRRATLPKPAVSTAFDAGPGAMELSLNPRRAVLSWRTGVGELWVAGVDGSGRRKAETAAGRVLQSLWGPDGRTLLYLLAPAEAGRANEIREWDLDARADKLIGKTSQFGAFARNSDATVFAGASLNKASPYMLLLLRVTRRELPLCEHRARAAADTALLFSPNSQLLIWQGDRIGKPALYMMRVDKLVEKTES